MAKTENNIITLVEHDIYALKIKLKWVGAVV